MEINPTVNLNSGVKMPLIGLGMLNFKNNDKTFNLNDFITKAANAGYRHFDVPNSAPHQQAIGNALKLVLQAKVQLQDEEGEKIDEFEQLFPREQIFITYKVYNKDDIEKQIKSALERLKLDYFDLVMMNCPQTPPEQQKEAEKEQEGGEQEAAQEEVPQKTQSMKQGWRLLQKAVEDGLTRSIGVSNFTVQALLNLYPFVQIKPAVNQIECHPFLQQKSMVALCKKLKMTVIAYSPLCRGGKDQKQPLGDKIDYQNDPILKDISAKYAKTLQQIMLNYQITRGIAVIPKTEKADHLNDNFNITDFELLEEDKTEIESLDRNGKVKAYQLKNTPIWKGTDPLC